MGRVRNLTLSSSPIVAFIAAVVVVLWLLPPLPSVAQERAGKAGTETDKTVAAQRTKEQEKLRKQQAVLLVKEFANRAFSFEDTASRVLSIARFADLLWTEDETHARDLFARALELCIPKTDAEPADTAMRARLRRDVIAIVSQRDIQLAKEFAKDNDDPSTSDSAATNIRVANKLLKSQPEQAMTFALNSIEGGISMDTAFFLLRLRAQNEEMANRMFLQVLNRLRALNCIEPEALILLGTYVFTFPGYVNEPNLSPTMIKYIGIGPVMLPDIRADRAEVPRQLILAYLEAAATTLSSSVCASQDRGQMYAASYLLLNKTELLAPELSARLAASMQSLRDTVPRELLEDGTYKKLKTGPQKTLDETLAEIENKSGVDLRDAQYFALVFDLWRRSDFENARKVTSKISVVSLRERLGQLILFGEGAQLIKSETKIGDAERIADKLPLGIERVLMRLGLASLYARKKNETRAEELLNLSLRDTRRLNDNRVPFLLLATASELAGLHSPEAMTLLAESVRKLNADKSKEEVVWSEKISCGALWRDWPLEIKGIDNSFDLALPRLIEADTDVTVESVLKVSNERYLSQALLTVANLILQNSRNKLAQTINSQ
jgi:hypothetical protein